MSVKQISVFIENKTGKLAEATRYIADHNINLRALSIADTQEFGILRIICDDPKMADAVLKEGGYITTVTDVLAAAISDTPGSLASILEVLSDAKVVVEYTYAFNSSKAGAYMIFRVEDTEAATKALAAQGIGIVEQEEIAKKNEEIVRGGK